MATCGLTERLVTVNLNRNLVFSLLSIHAMLSLLAISAGCGTLDKFLGVLCTPLLDDLALFASYMATSVAN
uniref:Uncharacterized protein n=1 Tax=Oryza punctata TaxID=4537 RepID=A0A0E0ME03_ORYPU